MSKAKSGTLLLFLLKPAEEPQSRAELALGVDNAAVYQVTGSAG